MILIVVLEVLPVPAPVTVNWNSYVPGAVGVKLVCAVLVANVTGGLPGSCVQA